MADKIKGDRWRAWAAEALATAAQIADPEARRVMWQVATAYWRLAERAEWAEDEGVRVVGGLSYGPEALSTVCHAFDEAWWTIAGNIGDDPIEVEAVR